MKKNFKLGEFEKWIKGYEKSWVEKKKGYEVDGKNIMVELANDELEFIKETKRLLSKFKEQEEEKYGKQKTI